MHALQTAKRIAKVFLGRDLFLKPQVEVRSEFHGEEHAGFAVYPLALDSSSIVYSVGVGDNISFDLSLMQKYGLQIHAFDPTPRCLAWIKRQSLPAAFRFTPLGMAAQNGSITFYSPAEESHVSFSTTNRGQGSPVECEVRTFFSLAKERGHTKIDLLKINIEGSEYEVIPDILKSGIPIGQILAEFHHRTLPKGAKKTQAMVRLLNDHGFLLFAVSDSGEELSFVHRSELGGV